MTSASTLSRQAAILQKKGLGKVAKRMREKAAKMRRDGRKGKKPRQAGLTGGTQQHLDEIGSELNQALYGDSAVVGRPLIAGAQQRLNQMRATSVDSMALANAPGHGEIVGGYLAHMAKELAELARKKGGVDAIQGRLMTLEHQNRHDEKVYARERERKAVQAVREEMRDKIVCGFIAKFDAAEAYNSLTPAAIMSIDEISNLVDALKANGYRADGRR